MPNRNAILWCALTFVAVSAALGLFAFRSEVLYDTDSYFHLAMGKLYATEGVVDELAWTRFSLLRDGVGDKEFLFHVLLAPFSAAGSPGGRLALALLNGVATALIVLLGWRAVGRWALWLAPLCLLASQDYIDRAIRLRPELLALVLFLLATEMASRDRMKSLGLVTFVFALSYTAIHALLALALLWLIGRFVLLREFRPGLIVAPTIGAGLGLIAHPHFPHNLVVWKVQTIDFFRYKSSLDVGTEIQPATTDVLLRNNWGWVLALVVLALSLRPRQEASEPGDQEAFARAALTYGFAAFAFVGLTLLMHRFTLYAVPFTLLAACFEAARRGLRPSARLAAVGRLPRAPTLALLLAVLALPAADVLHQLWGMATATGGELSREDDWRRLGESLPVGTRVAADWGDAQPLTFFAPHLEYLNVLDPVFMALPFPEAHRALRDLLEGKSPDPVATLVESLDSQVFVASRFFTPPDVLAAWIAHPQIETVYAGYMMAFSARPPTSVHRGRWTTGPPGAQPPVRAHDPSATVVDPHPASGYVDLSDRPGDCVLLTSEALASARRYELAPWGPTELWVGPQRLLTFATSARRTAGSGIDVEVPAGGPVTVWTCRDSSTGRTGFSLRPLGAPAPR